MARYFSDYDDGETKYVDTIGTELASPEQVPDEGIGLLATMFRDTRALKGSRTLIASIRDDRGRVIYQVTLTLQGVWTDQGVKSHVLPASENRLHPRPE